MLRIAGDHGLAQEAVDLFDAAVFHGDDEAEAAWWALSEWDLLEFVPCSDSS